MNLLPFLQINGSWYVVVNWIPSMKPSQRLDLRPLTARETAWLEPELENAYMDVWGRLFKNDNAILNGAAPPQD